MARRYDAYRRLESKEPFGNLGRGFRAEIHDPVWFLGKQWQMGEHQGEDASTPIKISANIQETPIDPLLNDPRMDPRIVPPEAIVESEPSDWWTPGRRIQLGAAYAAVEALPAVGSAGVNEELLLQKLPAPYQRFNNLGYDGQELHLVDPNHQLFVEAGTPEIEPVDLWDPAELAYNATFSADNLQLSLERHDGGNIDWYFVDANNPLQAGNTRDLSVIPTRMRYPGAPHPRWWQIEDSQVDIGGFPPDRGHFATMLLLDLVVSHSDDWFTFPITTEVGHIIKLHEVSVRDSFDEDWIVQPPAGWTLFSVTGLETSSMLLWPTVTMPLRGIDLEEIVVGVDEDANLLWAVEIRADGVELATEGLAASANGDAEGVVEGDAPPSFRFLPATGLRLRWHPYKIDTVNGRRRFVQGRAADLNQNPPELLPAPLASLLVDQENYTDDPANQVEPVHQIEPAAVPRDGLRLKRNWMMVRQTDGLPRIWVQRRRTPLLSPPAANLHFDIFEQLLTGTT